MGRQSKLEREKRKKKEAVPRSGRLYLINGTLNRLNHSISAVLAYLDKRLAVSTIIDLEDINAFVKDIIKLRHLPEMQPDPSQLRQQLRYCMTLAQNHGKPLLFSRLSRISGIVSNHIRPAASHQDKRTLVHRLNLACSHHRSLAELLDGYPIDSDAPLGTLFNPRIIERTRDFHFGPRTMKNTILTDTRSRSDPRDFVCDEEAGFYRVPVTESVIFFAKDKDGKVGAELIVLRDVFGDSSPERDKLLEWYQHTIEHACAERRDVRPNHPGHMAQVGYNAGPFHARVFGTAKSYTKNLDEETRTEHDLDAIAAITILWALAKALAPADITEAIEKTLADSGMPRIATRDVPPGTGYRIILDGQTYLFPFFDRSPPEGYLTIDYSASLHTDPAYVPGACAISLNVGRKVDAPEHTSSPAVSAPSMRSRLRSGAEKGKGSSSPSLDPSVDNPALWPAAGGGNFVDMSLRVVVEQATGTLFIFDPTHKHGTTRLCGAHNYTASFTFSQRIMEAFEKAKLGAQIEAGKGAGDGNFDFANV
ncbi:hypothetical protein R3P38DRAFT_3347404 [Favolaschia claudopus]|uniref:Uncharacterized protein n=2 Tax=Favolaschia claudopus TaxID=2862362 RepID=A0AAW0CZE3_9AGAR